MHDQASDLRNIVLRAGLEAGADAAAPRVVTVAGMRSGVGTTTIAVNASLAVAEQGWRVVLVDADPHRGDVAHQCGLGELRTSTIIGRDDLHESLVLGPCGLQIAPCTWDRSLNASQSERAIGRLLKQIRALGRHAELVVVDVGSADDPVVERFWRNSDSLLLVGTPSQYTIIDGYSTIKRWVSTQPGPQLAAVINRAQSYAEAMDAYHRIEQSSMRFLHQQLPLAGWAPEDEAFARVAERHQPLWLGARTSPAAETIATWADTWLHGRDIADAGDGEAAAA